MENIMLPEGILWALRALNAAGYEAYAVGGCVRDHLMGRVPDDYDLTTAALPQETRACFWGLRTIDTGIKHGTVTVKIENKPVEITTFRVDGQYLDSRHPENVTFSRNLRDDLKRRDFTVNAMAYHPDTGLIDPFGGRDDIKKKRVACVGDAPKRFDEDALRILRALRFASTLNFEIAPETQRAMHEKRESLSRISAERICAELYKLIAGPGASRTMRAYTDVTNVFAPEMRPLPENAPADRNIRLALTFENALSARRTLTRLRADGATVRDVCLLVDEKNADCPDCTLDMRRLIGRIGCRDARRVILARCALRGQDAARHIQVIDRLEKEGVCQSMRDLAISGRDLIALGFTPGPAVGRALETLYREAVDGNIINDRESLLRAALPLTR